MILPILHVITTDEILARADFVDQAVAVMQALGPRGALHLRGPQTPTRHLCTLAETLAPKQRDTHAMLVINDRLDIALASGARGVQLPERGLSPQAARQATIATKPPLSIGVSVHDTEGGLAASQQASDWLMVGHVFATPSHSSQPALGLARLRAIAVAVTTPVIAIGGVRPEDVPAVRAAGAYGVAAIRGIWESGDAALACHHYLSLYDSPPDRRPDRESSAVIDGVPDGQR